MMKGIVKMMALAAAMLVTVMPAEAKKGGKPKPKAKTHAKSSARKKTAVRKPAAKPKPKPQVDMSAVKVKSPDGRYLNYTNLPGRKPRYGDYGRMHVVMTSETGIVLTNTYQGARPALIPIETPKYPGDMSEYMVQMSVGDSADIFVTADSLAKGQPLVPGVQSGSRVRVTVKLIQVLSPEELEKEKEVFRRQMREVSEQAKADTTAILEYCRQNNIKPLRTASGLYYVIDKLGTGEEPENGDEVAVHYTGKFLDGKVFDSSRDRDEPLSFTLGQGRVIKGWEEGIALLPQGTKARLFIPSAMAYGTRGAGEVIPPNAVLIFDVELMEVATGE